MLTISVLVCAGVVACNGGDGNIPAVPARVTPSAPPPLSEAQSSAAATTPGPQPQATAREPGLAPPTPAGPPYLGSLAPGAITTIAGAGPIGEGIPAVNARLSFPWGVAVDGEGNLYIADTPQNRIRRVDARTGIITTIAGTGERGDQGDGALAVDAQLASPRGVAVDGSGNVYIADTVNQRVRKVQAVTGGITTVAETNEHGNGGPAALMSSPQPSLPSALAVDGAGNIFIADAGRDVIFMLENSTGILRTAAGTGRRGFGGDGGPAAQAQLADPTGVAMDPAGNLFIADTGNQRIRRVAATDGAIATVVGTGEAGYRGDGGPATGAQLHGPIDVATDGAGNLFIADSRNSAIRRVDGETGVITTVAGTGVSSFGGDGGAATDAMLNRPHAVAVDGAGNLFIADLFNRRIRKVDAETGVITTVAGLGRHGFGGDGEPATSILIYGPADVAVDADGDIFIAELGNHRIRRVDRLTGSITTVAGTGEEALGGDWGPATSAQLAHPSGVAVDNQGNLFIADWDNHRIRKVELASGIISTVSGTGDEGFRGDGGPALDARLSSPRSVAVDRAGNLFIADIGNHRVRRVNAVTGNIVTVAGTGEAGFHGDGGPAADAGLDGPIGLAVDASGNLFIADLFNRRIRRVDARSGLIFTVAGAGEQGSLGDGGAATGARLLSPKAVAVDIEGNLFISDQAGHRIRRVDAATGIITTVAGAGDAGFQGDGGAATLALFRSPGGLAVDGEGNLFIADSENHRIRAVRGP